MLKSIAIVFATVAGLTLFTGAQAAVSLPLGEAGLALASNSGSGVDTIATPINDGGSSLQGTRADREPDVSADTNGRDVSSSDTSASSVAHTDRNHASTENAPKSDAGAPPHKARANAHWQSLLPGLMK